MVADNVLVHHIRPGGAIVQYSGMICGSRPLQGITHVTDNMHKSLYITYREGRRFVGSVHLGL